VTEIHGGGRIWSAAEAADFGRQQRPTSGSDGGRLRAAAAAIFGQRRRPSLGSGGGLLPAQRGQLPVQFLVGRKENIFCIFLRVN
jgi:hypothetical protein